MPVITSQRRIDLSSEPEAMVRLFGDHASTLIPARWPVRVLRRGKGVEVEWILMVASAEAEARYFPHGEKRIQVMPRAWARIIPLLTGLKVRCFQEEDSEEERGGGRGGGVGVRVGRGGGRESTLGEREGSVALSLEISSSSSLLLFLSRETVCACHGLRRRCLRPLSLLLVDRECSLFGMDLREPIGGLWLRCRRSGEGDRCLEEAVDDWLEVLRRLGWGPSRSIAGIGRCSTEGRLVQIWRVEGRGISGINAIDAWRYGRAD